MTAVLDVFRRTFTNVWNGIPDQDRERLLAYWETQTPDPSYLNTFSPAPHIQVVATGPWSPAHQACKRLGAELTFPISLVAEHPHRLAVEIGRALVHVYRIATQRHWRLVQNLIQEPLARWKKRQGKKLTDHASDQKEDELEAAYRRAFEAEVAQLLLRWNLKELGQLERRRDE